MNQSLSDLTFYYINRLQQYETCRQQSQCYLLVPPPRPPILPIIIFNNSPSTVISHRQDSYSILIVLGILFSSCFCLLLIGLKLRQRYCRTKNTNIHNELTSCSSIFPISYNSLTALTSTTNQLTTTTNTVNRNYQQHLTTIDQLSYYNQLTNIYEQIRLSSSDCYCSCCLCTQIYDKHQEYFSMKHQFTPYYSTYESIPSEIVCQNCLLKT